ncbi:helix-turn-helix transcriptional regulator [Sphingomonas sp. PB4P5]|uniref:helix-turn-helix transcriptional regulator n=1 Tax=Parasphingomonas puruogangriensis TaxID=3096155 RepID=UPI002FC9876E
MQVDLTCLSDTERSILLLLAEGHTAKSIAAEMGASVPAVNERLREARRKTGVGSSRELARLLRGAAPENRDDKIGVVPGPTAASSSGHPIRPAAGGITKGMIVMTSFVLSGGVLAALALNAATPSAPARPTVVKVRPGEGTKVAAGPFTFRVTFDRPMRVGSYSFVTVDAGTYPDCAAKPRQSAEGKTFTLDCIAAPGRSYAIGINGGRFWNFVDAETGAPAEAVVVRFGVR